MDSLAAVLLDETTAYWNSAYAVKSQLPASITLQEQAAKPVGSIFATVLVILILVIHAPASGAQTKGIQNVSLVREQSSPAVYLIVGDNKFWIVDPAEFAALGFDWGKVRIVADGALSRFTQGLLHAPPKTKASDVFFDCPDLDWPIVWDGKHYGNCKSSAFILRKDVLVAGWLKDPNKTAPYVNSKPLNGSPPGIEDIHYNLELDAAFLDRMYGKGGLSTALANAFWPGDPTPNPLRFAVDPPLAPGGPNVAPFNSWILPCSTDEMHGELNAWHVNTVGCFWCSHWEGHGTPPGGWNSQIPDKDTNSFFPFNPLDPGNTGRPLRNGDYVLMRGTVWQETYHSGCGIDSVWNQTPFAGHGGIVEMHPPDWIVRVREPNINARVTTSFVAVAAGNKTQEKLSETPTLPGSTTRRVQFRKSTPVIDRNFSNVSDINAAGQTGNRFKQSVLWEWSEVDNFDLPWVDDQTPPGAVLAGTGEAWNWINDNVFFGPYAHRSALASGIHQHFFTGATAPMTVSRLDTLFAMVFLDPDNPPGEVMLQWHMPTGWVRAYWGDNLIGWGTNGTPDRLPMGPLPPTGEWIRLEIPAQSLGINNTVNVDGMAFTLYGGRATWDYAGRNNAGETVQ